MEVNRTVVLPCNAVIPDNEKIALHYTASFASHENAYMYNGMTQLNYLSGDETRFVTMKPSAFTVSTNDKLKQYQIFIDGCKIQVAPSVEFSWSIKNDTTTFKTGYLAGDGQHVTVDGDIVSVYNVGKCLSFYRSKNVKDIKLYDSDTLLFPITDNVWNVKIFAKNRECMSNIVSAADIEVETFVCDKKRDISLGDYSDGYYNDYVKDVVFGAELLGVKPVLREAHASFIDKLASESM